MPLSGPRLERPVDLPRILERGLAERPDELALVSLRMRWTWRELDEASTRLALNYMARGLEPGDRVASLLPNRTVLMVHYIACFKAGFVAMPLNYRYTPPEMDHAMSVGGASMLVVHSEREDDVAASSEAAKLRCGTIVAAGTVGDSLAVEALLAEAPPERDLPYPDPDTPAFVLFTSGSTGKPKGATHTLKSFGYLVASIARGMELSADDVFMAGSSISHMGSLKMALGILSVGGQLAIARNFDPDEFLPVLREFRPTAAFVLPAALSALIRDHGARPDDFASLRLLLSGGDTIPSDLEDEVAQVAGLPIDELFGMTEAGTAFLNPPSGLIKRGSVGLLNPGYVASLRDEEGHEVPNGSDGRLFRKGPAVMTGYWNNPDATAEALQDGWYDTGDILAVDEDVYFWFRGRKKQIIVHDSSNISPLEVEMAVLTHPAVDLAGVVGVRDAIHGENVWVYVTIRDGFDRPLSQEIIEAARQQVGYKAPEVVVVIDEMPLNPTGKVDREALKRMAAERVSAAHVHGDAENAPG
ncbi:MAG: class I adenylate-forming enzyme family protein [Pseudomonadota bacterium]